MQEKKRILLIFPPDIITIEPFRSIKKKHDALVSGFPLGLGYIAAYLLKTNKYNVRILDAVKNELSVADVLKIIEEFSPHYIGISMYTVNSKVAVKLAKEIKANFSDKIVIAGGPHASEDYQNLFKNYPFFDFVVIGEGEITMLELLDILSSGDLSRVKEINGIAYNDFDNNKVVFTGMRPFCRNIDQFPIPARELVDFNSYIIQGNLLPYAVEIMGSRGCVHRCVFCSFQKVWRPRKPLEIIKELKYLTKRYPKAKSFLFFDDNFSVDKRRVIQLCQLLIQEGLNKYMWSCLCRADHITEEMLVWMKRAGCVKIAYGLESVDPVILKNLNKKLNPAQLKNAVELTTKVGIDTLTFFIIGSPGETLKTIKTSYDFAKKLKCKTTLWSIMQIYPGTALAKLQPCSDSVAYLYEPEVKNPIAQISANIPVFENPGLDRETLKVIYRRIFRNIVVWKALYHPFFTIKKILRAPKEAFRFLKSLWT